jgi:two-component system response regulator WspF
VDVLFDSLAQHWRGPAAAALLTGMGRDGARGLGKLKEAGWLTFAQDEASSVVYGMPKAAAQLGAASKILAPVDIAAELARFVQRR